MRRSRCAGDLEQIALAVNRALADPHLHTQDTHLGERLGQAVVHVGAEGVQRYATLLDGLGTGHLGAAHTTCDLHLDTLGTHAHGRGYGHLHGAAERYAALQLAGDVLTDDDGVYFGTLHLEDVDLNLLAGELLQLLLQFVDLLAALADDDTRTGGSDGNGNEFERTLDDNLRNTCLGKTDIQVLTNLSVL